MSNLSPIQKRFLIALPLSIVLGFISVWFGSSSTPGIWWTPLMWMIVTDCFLIGAIVGLAGVYTRHPVFNFPLPTTLRWAVLGAIASLPLATGGMIAPVATMGPWTIFFWTLVAGAIYGLIIDLAATKWGGEGKELLGN